MGCSRGDKDTGERGRGVAGGGSDGGNGELAAQNWGPSREGEGHEGSTGKMAPRRGPQERRPRARVGAQVGFKDSVGSGWRSTVRVGWAAVWGEWRRPPGCLLRRDGAPASLSAEARGVWGGGGPVPPVPWRRGAGRFLKAAPGGRGTAVAVVGDPACVVAETAGRRREWRDGVGGGLPWRGGPQASSSALMLALAIDSSEPSTSAVPVRDTRALGQKGVRPAGSRVGGGEAAGEWWAWLCRREASRQLPMQQHAGTATHLQTCGWPAGRQTQTRWGAARAGRADWRRGGRGGVRGRRRTTGPGGARNRRRGARAGA